MRAEGFHCALFLIEPLFVKGVNPLNNPLGGLAISLFGTNYDTLVIWRNKGSISDVLYAGSFQYKLTLSVYMTILVRWPKNQEDVESGFGEGS